MNSKDLLTTFQESGGTISPGFCTATKRVVTDLLIRQWLLARWLRRTGKGLLNLKDLLTVFPPLRKGSIEDVPVLKPPFRAESRQISPFSSRNVQIAAQNGGFSAAISWHACRIRWVAGCERRAAVALLPGHVIILRLSWRA